MKAKELSLTAYITGVIYAIIMSVLMGIGFLKNINVNDICFITMTIFAGGMPVSISEWIRNAKGLNQ